MKLLDLWDDLEDVTAGGRKNGRKYYSLAHITWSRPRAWAAGEDFDVPRGWAGEGGVYAFIRKHPKQVDGPRIAYIGKALNFSKRLTVKHDHYAIVERRGETAVTCGRVRFERVRAHPGYYLEIEDVVKFAVWHWLENTQGFASLPGFRDSQPRAMRPWVIHNSGYRVGGLIPKRVVYPAIGVEY